MISDLSESTETEKKNFFKQFPIKVPIRFINLTRVETSAKVKIKSNTNELKLAYENIEGIAIDFDILRDWISPA